MHPATKLSHMIDLVLLRMNQRFYCTDVQVMRGATCWTDHKLVRAKLKIDLPELHQREKRVLPFAVHKLNASTARDAYRRHLEGLLLDYPSRTESTPEANWETIKSCIVSAAEEEIGRGKRKQPEWFEENQEELME